MKALLTGDLSLMTNPMTVSEPSNKPERLTTDSKFTVATRKDYIMITMIRNNLATSTINTMTSPFAVRDNETLEYVAPPEKLWYISQYSITPVQREVLVALDDLMIATTLQITDKIQASMDVTADEVKKALATMWRGGYIHKMQFVNDDGSSSNSKVYILSGTRGSALFKTVFGRKAFKVRFMEQITDITTIKNFLAVNQLILHTGNIVKENPRAEKMERSSVIPMLRTTFSIQGSFINTDGDLIICEAIRRKDSTNDKLTDRLKKLKKLVNGYDHYSNCFNSDFEIRQKPKVVFICEDERHIEEICSITSKMFNKDDVIYTHDLGIVKNYESSFLTADRIKKIA